MADGEIKDSGLLCFAIVLKFFGIPIDNKQMEYFQNECDVPLDFVRISQFSKEFKIKTKIHQFNFRKGIAVNSPIIAKSNEGEYFVIVKKQDDRFVLLFPLTLKQEIFTIQELKLFWDGVGAILSKKRMIDQEAVFSFKWFIPTILKFKTELVYVLIAVFGQVA